MMQQLATQSSQIAALRGGQVNSQGKASTDATNGASSAWPDNKTAQQDTFSELLNQQSQQSSKQDTASRAARGKSDDASGKTSASDKPVKDPAQEASKEKQQAVSDKSGDESVEDQVSVSNEQATAEAKSQGGGNAHDTTATSEQNSDAKTEKSDVQDPGSSVESTTDIAAQTNMTDGEQWLHTPQGTTESGGDKTDYLAIIDGIRALQDKLTSQETPVTSEMLNQEINKLDLHGWKQGSGEFMPTDVLNDLQEWLATLLPEGMKLESDGGALQQVADAETLLSDVLNLVQQLNKTAGATGTDEASAQADTLLQVLAAELLSGLRASQAGDNSSNASSATAEDPALKIDNVTVDLSAIANIEIAEDAIIVADSTDQSLQNQASLLVSLMRQIQSANGQSGAEASPANKNNGAATGKPSAESLEALLGQTTDATVSELAQVMTDSVSKANPLLTDSQLGQIRSQLVTGMEEIRSQLKQGHEPAIDLTALVSQTIQEVAPDMVQGQNTALPVMQEVQQLAQLASLANLGSSQERQIAELVAVSRDVVAQDVRQHHGDTMKSMQQQAALDKPVPIHQPQGQQQIAEKIRWMVNGRQTMAEIRLDPPELGSMQVRLNVSGDSAAVSFVVQSQHAKEALADAMPRLRDMFAEQGIELGESFVSQQQTGDKGDGEPGQHQGDGLKDEDFNESEAKETRVVRPANGLIDDYV